MITESFDGLQLAKVRYRFRGPGSWRVRHFELFEEIGAPYVCTIELVSDDESGDSRALFGACCTLEIIRGVLMRHVHGVAFSVVNHGTSHGHVAVQIKLCPALLLSSHGEATRIFPSGMTAPEIIKQVLDDPARRYHRNYVARLGKKYVGREICVQFRESNLQFVRRLMQEEGISFYFNQVGQDEEVVMVDDNEAFPVCKTGDGEPVPLAAFGAAAPVESLLSFESVLELAPTKVTILERDWTRPAVPFQAMAATQGDPPVWELYEHCVQPLPLSGYDLGKSSYTREHLAERAQLRLESIQARMAVRGGSSNVTGLSAGMVFEARGLPVAGENQKYLTLSVRHVGDAEIELASAELGLPAGHDGYRNWLTCIPVSVPYRPARTIPRPAVLGIVGATVVGPKREEVEPDAHGRVLVHFHWDRERRSTDESACWVRVAQAWAGAGFGTLFIPRIGMEVAVQFVEGNPDWPIIVGCLYNGDNPPPYKLPRQKTQSGIRTRTSTGGRGANELRFEDKRDEEEIHIHAQKDMNEVVKHNHTMDVGSEEHTVVGSKQTLEVGARGKSEGLVARTIHGQEKIEIDDNKTETVKAVYALTTDKKFELTQDQTKLTFEGNDATLKVGGEGEVTIDRAPAKVTIAKDGVVTVSTDANATLRVGGKGEVTIERPPAKITVEQSGAITVSTQNTNVTIHCGAENRVVVSPCSVEIASAKIECQAGTGKVVVDTEGVIIKGTTVKLNA